jgi:hypothetical protein
MKFHNPIAPRSVKERQAPLSYKTPEYDERTMIFEAGTNYGTGFNQPIGTTSSKGKSAVPYGKNHEAY